MAWYDNSKRTTYVAEYKDAKAIDSDAKRAGPKGWTIVSTTGEDGKVRVMGTLAKGALTGGIGLLVFGRSRKQGKVIVSWQRVSVTSPEMPTPPTVDAQPATSAAAEADPQGVVLWAGSVRYLGGHPAHPKPDRIFGRTRFTLRGASIHVYRGQREESSKPFFAMPTSEVESWTINNQHVAFLQRDTWWRKDAKVLVLQVRDAAASYNVSFQLPQSKFRGDVGGLEQALNHLRESEDNGLSLLTLTTVGDGRNPDSGDPAPNTAVASPNVENSLLELTQLHDRGLIDDDEYMASRRDILSRL